MRLGWLIRHISVFVAVLLNGFLLAGCTAQLASGPPPGPGTYLCKTNFTTSGYQRAYRLHVPAGYSAKQEYPLIIAIHGAFKTASRFEKETGLSQMADRKGYVVAYPEGIGIFGLLQHWNAGFCCGKAARDQVDDVGFITWVIDDVGTRLAIDRHRTYLIGFSNGGMLAYKFGAEKPNKVAAIAVLSAAIGSRPGSEAPTEQVNPPKTPVPLIVFHGREDRLIPYGGGRAVASKSQREYIAVEDAIRAWARGNGCGSTPKMRYLQKGAVTEETWPCADPRASVVGYYLEGWGHRWPGGEAIQTLSDTDPLKGFEAADIIFDFFEKLSGRF